MKELFYKKNKENGGSILGNKEKTEFRVLIFTDLGNVVYTDMMFKDYNKALSMFWKQWHELNDGFCPLTISEVK